MGMGDKKKEFKPSYGTTICDVSHLEFADSMIVQCPHPAVQERYGFNGLCNVSIYICRKCKFKKTYPMHGGISCGYELE